jgi:hypothetical protein
MNLFSFIDQKKACSTGDTQGVAILTGGLLGFVWARVYLSKLEARGVCEVRKSEAGA